MIDVDLLIRDRREHLAPLPDGNGADWADVLARAGLAAPKASSRRRPLRLALGALAALIAATAFVAVATPVGGAISKTFRDFSAWLRGEPGEPATEAEQRAFDEENARSFAAFPGSPQLRRLLRAEQDGIVFELLGFRSGGSLCIRVRASGDVERATLTCAPISELEHGDAPARVLLADWPVGQGEKRETIGFNTYTSARAQVTAGIAADGVESVELVDDHGTHHVPTESNAFLYVAARPEVGQRVTHARARLESGETVGVPFTVVPWGPSPGFGAANGEPGGPTEVERVVRGGRIGWVDRREERGEPLDASRDKFKLRRDAEFVRVLTPDEASSKRIVISVHDAERGPSSPPSPPARVGLCTSTVSREGSTGTCLPLDRPFERWPFTFGYGVMGEGAQFATFAGVASDDVARLEIFTATGDQVHVPLKDNAFLAEVALARFPVKMVAYDAEGRVISIATTRRDEGPARIIGKPVLELSASAAGVGSLQLKAYRTHEGGECWLARATGKERVNTSSCVPRDWQTAPMRIGTLPAFFYGRVRSDIVSIELRFSDGTVDRISPGERGYILHVIPERFRDGDQRLVEIIGRGREGNVVDQLKMSPSR